MTQDSDREAAATLLQRAHAAHADHRIGEALTYAQRAVSLDPAFVEARTYLGTTLITRYLQYEDGLAQLEEALRLAPDDPGVHYSLGWCYEFVAYRLEKQATRPYRDPLELYELAAEHLRRCIELQPEQGLQEDAQDLLDAVLERL